LGILLQDRSANALSLYSEGTRAPFHGFFYIGGVYHSDTGLVAANAPMNRVFVDNTGNPYILYKDKDNQTKLATFEGTLPMTAIVMENQVNGTYDLTGDGDGNVFMVFATTDGAIQLIKRDALGQMTVQEVDHLPENASVLFGIDLAADAAGHVFAIYGQNLSDIATVKVLHTLVSTGK
jgi:hypothetical protein